MNKFIYGVASMALAAVAPSAALAAVGMCADYADVPYSFSDLFSEQSLTLPFQVNSGDRLVVDIDYQRYTLDPKYNDPSWYSFSFQGSPVTDGPFTTIGLGESGSTQLFTYTIPDVGADPVLAVLAIEITATEAEGQGYSLTIYCDPSGSNSDTGVSIDKLRDRASTLVYRNAERINRLVNGSIDAAFGAGGESDAANGRAGSVIVDLTPEELAETGLTLWGAAAYEAVIPGTGGWAGADVTGVGGLNYRVNHDLVIGLFGAVGGGAHADGDASIGTRGVAAGGVAALRLDDVWRAQLVASAQKWRYDLVSNGTTASYDSLLIAIDGTVQGVLPVSAFVDFVPEVGVQVRQDRQDGFVDSANVAYAERITMGVDGTAGGEFRFYPLGGSDLVVTAGGSGSYGSLGLRGAVEAGLIVNVAPGVRVDVDGAVRNIGSTTGTTAAITGRLSSAL